MTFIGFALLVSACGNDACDALPVTEDLYPTHSECLQDLHKIQLYHPTLTFMCNQVFRDENTENPSH